MTEEQASQILKYLKFIYADNTTLFEQLDKIINTINFQSELICALIGIIIGAFITYFIMKGIYKNVN